MKHLVVLFSLLLWAGSVQAQTEKAVPVTKLPGEENLSLRERAERDFLMPVRRKKTASEAPKIAAEDNTAAPETDATAHYSEATDEAAVSARTARSYEIRHAEALASRRAAARREEARLEARAEARRAARYAARHGSKSKSSKSKSHKAATHSSKASKARSSKSKTKTKSAAHTSKTKSKAAKAKANHTAKKVSVKKKTAAHKTTRKATASKSKSKASKKHRR